jgi:hypothetical protein
MFAGLAQRLVYASHRPVIKQQIDPMQRLARRPAALPSHN